MDVAPLCIEAHVDVRIVAALGFARADDVIAVADSAFADRKRGHGMHGGHHGGMASQVSSMAERYDLNDDGQITQEEIDSNRAEWHAEFSGDGDAMTLEQFQDLWLRARHRQMVREFQRFDRDGDGQITLEEFQRPMSTAEFHHLCGKYLAERQKALGQKGKSLLATCHELGITEVYRLGGAQGVAALAYTTLLLLAMALVGRETGLAVFDFFTPYNRVISAISPLGRDREGRLVWRGWLRSLPVIPAWPGLWFFAAVMIGTVTYDGAAGTDWFRAMTGGLGDSVAGSTLPTTMIAMLSGL